MLLRCSPPFRGDTRWRLVSQLSLNHLSLSGGDDAWRGFCHGMEITLKFDENRFSGASAFLLGAVLSRFFALYAAADSFTQLVTTSRQRDGTWTIWHPLCGETPVL